MAKKITRIRPWTKEEVRMLKTLARENVTYAATGLSSRASPTLVRMQEIGRHAYASTEMTLRLRGALRQ